MQWTPEQVAEAVGGRIIHAGDGGRSVPSGLVGGPLTGATIDSRLVAPGNLFVPIRAERDGHDYIAAALAAGAGGYLIAADQRGRLAPGGSGAPVSGVAYRLAGRRGPAVIEVADTSAALLRLGAAARHRTTGPVVGVTGSVGKTSTKDLAAAVLGSRFKVTSNHRSFNNELGVPLTLINAVEGSEVTVVEMGARGPGHISLLCRVAEPTMAVVTVVAMAHTAMFGDLAAVARAKSELVQALSADGLAVLNADDPLVAAMASQTGAAVIRCSAAGDASAEVAAEAIELDDQVRASFTLRSPWGTDRIQLAVPGRHQVVNALAALTVGLHTGVDLGAARQALADAHLSPWRMELSRAPGGAWVLNDAYNANPASMAAALRALADLPAERRVAVLGEMAELGPAARVEHERVVGLAAELDVEVIAISTDLYGPAPVVCRVSHIDEAVGALGDLGAGDAVLVKGSRVSGLERLANRLLSR